MSRTDNGVVIGLLDPRYRTAADASGIQGRHEPENETMFIPLRPRRLAGLAACQMLIVLVLGACAADGRIPGVVSLVDPSGSLSPSASLDAHDAKLAYETCMRDHGVDPTKAEGSSGGSVSAVTVTAAEAACRHLIDGLVSGPGSKPMDPAVMDQWLAWARCMRAHGVDVPDPGGAAAVTPIQIDKHSAAFQAAGQACQTAMPNTNDAGTNDAGPIPTGAKP